jgi:hypothetical protein
MKFTKYKKGGAVVKTIIPSPHNGGNDRFSARLGILTILTIGFLPASRDAGNRITHGPINQTLEDLKSMILNHDFKSNFA